MGEGHRCPGRAGPLYGPAAGRRDAADIERAFRAARVSLFPDRLGDLDTSCSCPDWANPCKHIAATHYILGERFDEDPFLLFRLRGRSQEQILQALRQRRAGQEVVEEPEEEEELEEALPLEANLDRFWDLGEPLDQFAVSIREPAIETPLLKRLGPAPFVAEPGLLGTAAASLPGDHPGHDLPGVCG